MGPGKRLRPLLCILACEAVGGTAEQALPAACAVEMVHTYSLVHDDLPAMDDDDVRRGQPTVHRKFDEATAILAGDSLLTYAFDIIAAPETTLPAAVRIELVLSLARASGHGGMAGGQAFDLEAEKRELDEDEIVRLQRMKTGALIRFGCEAGAILAGAPAQERARLRRFGEIVGLAFQLRDDLLDLTADSATLGKAAGKDAARGKKTLPSIHGIQWTQSRLAGLIEEANNLLATHGEKAGMLMALADYVATRKN
jgi:farnesyl diphosphate synthase